MPPANDHVGGRFFTFADLSLDHLEQLRSIEDEAASAGVGFLGLTRSLMEGSGMWERLLLPAAFLSHRSDELRGFATLFDFDPWSSTAEAYFTGDPSLFRRGVLLDTVIGYMSLVFREAPLHRVVLKAPDMVVEANRAIIYAAAKEHGRIPHYFEVAGTQADQVVLSIEREKFLELCELVDPTGRHWARPLRASGAFRR